MKKKLLISVFLIVSVSIFIVSCLKNKDLAEPPYELDVILHGTSGNSIHGNDKPSGYIKFRQDPDPDKIINLDTWVRNLDRNREYLLQRAVDAINVVDGNCTSTTWLTLGKGLTPQSILTDGKGNGNEALWRDITAIPTGSSFDIHFQVIDKISGAVVLTSDCYKYTVR